MCIDVIRRGVHPAEEFGDTIRNSGEELGVPGTPYATPAGLVLRTRKGHAMLLMAIRQPRLERDVETGTEVETGTGRGNGDAGRRNGDATSY